MDNNPDNEPRIRETNANNTNNNNTNTNKQQPQLLHNPYSPYDTILHKTLVIPFYIH